MTSTTRLKFLVYLMAFTLLFPGRLCGQGGFAEMVDRAFGSNQELVNGIQFSNQYIRSLANIA